MLKTIYYAIIVLGYIIHDDWYKWRKHRNRSSLWEVFVNKKNYPSI